MKSFKILLVEDNQGDILLTKEAFEESNKECEIFVVNDGQEAINFLEQIPPYSNIEAPNLILLDINLPKINGHEVLKYIKSNSTLKKIPVIMLTTSSSEKDINECYSNYANCYITKPNDVADFFKIIENVNNFWINNATIK
jgi:CheY-like chemotaxis protein